MEASLSGVAVLLCWVRIYIHKQKLLIFFFQHPLKDLHSSLHYRGFRYHISWLSRLVKKA